MHGLAGHLQLQLGELPTQQAGTAANSPAGIRGSQGGLPVGESWASPTSGHWNNLAEPDLFKFLWVTMPMHLEG